MLYKLAVWGVAMAAALTSHAPRPRQIDLPSGLAGLRLMLARPPTQPVWGDLYPMRLTSQVRRETALIAIRKFPGGSPPARGWINRHPVAVYTVIILMALVVGAITLRLLRKKG